MLTQSSLEPLVPAKYELVFRPFNVLKTWGAHFVSESVSISSRGMEPHRRTFTRTELSWDGDDAATVAMFQRLKN